MKARQRNRKIRAYCVELRGLQKHPHSGLLCCLGMLIGLVPGLPDAAFGQNLTSAPTLITSPSDANVLQGLFGVASAAPKATIEAPGTACFELLRGNGGRSGYVLTHGNVLPDSLSVYAAGMRLQIGRDCFLDNASGNLFLANPVRNGDAISVSYRYLDGATPAPAPGLRLSLAPGTQMGLLLGMSQGDGSGYTTTINGLSLNSAFGAGGLSRYTGMAYFSDVQTSSNVNLNLQPTSNAKAAARADVGSGQLLVQDLALQAAGLKFGADFQDVGKKFAGFGALRAANTGNSAALDQLKQLESEKGIQRLGFGLGWSQAAAKTAPQSSFALQWNTIKDGKGSIDQRNADLNSGLFSFHYAARDISNTYAAFTGLREADKAAWAHQQGLHAQSLGFALGFGGKKRAPGDGLSFQDQTFSDKSGSLQRDLYSFQSGGLGFSMLKRVANQGFKRLGDLSDDDKTTLALDILRAYNTTVDAKALTADDRAQVAKDAGVARSVMLAGMNLGKKGAFSFNQMAISSAPAASTVAPNAASASATATGSTPAVAAPGMSREAIDLNTGGFTFSLLSRRTDAGFSQLAGLPDTDKRYLALDILRQFNPAAQLSQVTPVLMAQAAAKELGLARTALNAGLTLGKAKRTITLGFSQIDLTDISATPATGSVAGATPQPGLTRQMFTLGAPRLQFTLTRQSIADQFTRVASLSDLERPQFGNTHGLQTRQIALDWQAGKTTKIGYTSLSVAGTQDAATDARTLASTAGTDPVAAVRSALAGLQRQTLTVEMKGLKLVAVDANTDRGFSRGSDLALPDADKKQVLADVGFRRIGETLHYDGTKGMAIDSAISNATDTVDNLFHDVFHHSFSYTPRKDFALTLQSEGDVAGTVGQENGSRHDAINFSSPLEKGTILKLAGDRKTTLVALQPDEQIVQDSIELDSTHLGAGGSVAYQVQNIAYINGKYQDTATFNLHAKPTSQLTVAYSMADMDRTPIASNLDEAGKSRIYENTDGLNVQYQATKQFAMSVDSSTTSTDDNKSGDTVGVGLQGEAFKNVTLAAKLNEVHTIGVKDTKDVANVAIGNTKPMTLGPLKALTVKAGYVSLNDQRKLQNEAMTGHAEWTLWKNTFLLDYNGVTTAPGQTTTSRIYQFTTDPNPKLRFHGSFYYKDKTLVDGKEVLIRRFAADLALSKKTQFVYGFGTSPEDAKGNITPQTTADISLKHLLTPKLTGLLFYKENNNTSTMILTRGLGLGLEGQLGPSTKLSLTWSKDTNGFATRYDRSDHLSLKFDHKISATDYLSLAEDFRSHDGRGVDGFFLQNEMRTSLDMNFRF